MSGSEYSYGSSPPSSTATTPPSISAPVGESVEDQPFVVPPEYEAQVNASFQEAVMSGEMQRNMTAATTNVMRANASSLGTISGGMPAWRLNNLREDDNKTHDV